MNTLFLRLEGPLQSWGERAHWSERDSAPEPTKSGVVGLLGCTLGWNDDDRLRRLSQAVRLAIRCDKAGTPLRDYHTVVGGVMSAEGKIKINASTKTPETLVSERRYLCDSSFLAVIQAGEDLIAQLAAAVQAPVWTVYLGRKSCPPACPIFEGVGQFSSLDEALAAWPLPERLSQDRRVRAIMECPPGEGIRRRDELISRTHRWFGPRYTRDVLVSVRPAKES